MEYKVQYDKKKLARIFSTLSSFSKGKLRFFDESSQEYIGEKILNLPFCRMLSRVPKSNSLCTKCNEAANNHCQNIKQGYSYFCHANLIEIVHPVYYESIYVGHISVGQFRSKQKIASDDYFAYLAELVGRSPEFVKKAYISHPLLDDKGIEGAKLLLELADRKLCDENVFRLDYYGTIAEVEQYVVDHLSSDLTLESIARHVYLNPSYLSTMYHKSTDRTLFSFIQRERISKSLYLLCNSTMSIKEISEAVGFKDANYFSKVFARENGCSPRQYLKKVANGEILQGDLQNEHIECFIK